MYVQVDMRGYCTLESRNVQYCKLLAGRCERCNVTRSMRNCAREVLGPLLVKSMMTPNSSGLHGTLPLEIQLQFRISSLTVF